MGIEFREELPMEYKQVDTKEDRMSVKDQKSIHGEKEGGYSTR
jgi:hypothetical protein